MPNTALSTHLLALKNAVNAAAPGLVRQQASAALALARLRVQRQGIAGAHYSTNLMPTFYFANEALNAGGRAYIAKNKLGNWQGLRAAEGLQTGYVDLTHSGRMFNSLTVAPGTDSGPVFTARVVASDQEGAEKVKRNRARYGDFLALLPAEAAEVAQVAQVAIARILQAPTT